MAGRKRTEPRADRAQTRRAIEVARKREAILEAAGRAFARGGYHATTMQDIAREAGYTPPSLYAYFDSKEQIFLDLGALLSREFAAVFEEPLPAQLPFRERLELLLTRVFTKADRYREAVSIFVITPLSRDASIGEGMVPPARGGGRFASLQLFTTWLRKNAKRGDVGDHRPEELGLALTGLVHAFCIQWLVQGDRAGIAGPVSRTAKWFLHGALGGSTPSRKASSRPVGTDTSVPSRASRRARGH